MPGVNQQLQFCTSGLGCGSTVEDLHSLFPEMQQKSKHFYTYKQNYIVAFGPFPTAQHIWHLLMAIAVYHSLLLFVASNILYKNKQFIIYSLDEKHQ